MIEHSTAARARVRRRTAARRRRPARSPCRAARLDATVPFGKAPSEIAARGRRDDESIAVARQRARARRAAVVAVQARRGARSRQRIAVPPTNIDVAGRSACGSLCASLRTSISPPHGDRSSGSRRATSRTPKARRAAASAPPISTKTRWPCARNRPEVAAHRRQEAVDAHVALA